MPHLVVKDVDLSKLQQLDTISWVASDTRTKRLFLLKMQEFLLEVKKRDDDYVIKADKITKPANSEKIKKTLLRLSQDAGLEIKEQNINPKAQKIESKFLKKIDCFEDFQTQKDINIEVGFGSGRHLLYQAKKYPQELFIGLEVHTASVEQVVKQLHLQNITNVLIVNYDARLFLEFLASNSCKNIYVHFPVPWDKKPHRRVISKAFVDESMRVLKKGGVLNLRTDSQNYFSYSFDTFMSQKKCECTICKNQDIAISSKYEDRWKKMQKNIYDFYLTCLEKSEPKIAAYDFSFDQKCRAEVEFKSYKYDGYFVHFENLYTIDSETVLLKVSFGSFDKPENRYILIQNNSAHYLFSKPVKTGANYSAHQKIAEMLSWQT